MQSFLRLLAVTLIAVLIPLALVIGSQISTGPAPPRAQAQSLAHQLDSLFQIRLRETFAIAAFPSIRAFASAGPESRSQRAAVALTELNAWIAADSPIREAFILSQQTKVILTTQKNQGRDWGARIFVKSALAGKLDVSPVSHDGGEFSQYYAAPILDNGGGVAGALVARVAAQELWDALNSAGDPGQGEFAVLVDENGVRLADGGDATRILEALAPLSSEVQTRIIAQQTYGEQVTLVRATNSAGALDAIRSGALDSLRASDLNVAALSAQRLTTKPWTVLVLSTESSSAEKLNKFIVPLIAAVVCSILASLVLSRRTQAGLVLNDRSH